MFMCISNLDARQQALEALRSVYLQQMQAAERRRRDACLRANEATSRTSQLADATYDAAVQIVTQARDAVVSSANAEFAAATAGALAEYTAATAPARELSREQCNLADERYAAKHQAAKEICDLEKAFALEILEVSRESCSDDSAEQSAYAAYRQSLDAAEAKFAAACAEAESTKRAERAAAHAVCNVIVHPAQQRYDEAVKPYAAAQAALSVPAQQHFGLAFNEIFETRQSVKAQANQENGAAHAAINEAYAKNRRARVLAWQRLMAAFDEFAALSSNEMI
jgi:hypothetical protein